MGGNLLSLVLVLALIAAAVLYWQLVVDRVHQRRLRQRMDAVAHLSAVARATLAERRRSAA